MTKVIAVSNQKGGVGKTTTALAMADVLHTKGFKVLFVDTDSQTNSTDTYNAQIDGVATMYDVILSDDPVDILSAVQTTNYGDIVPSDPLLRNADKILGDDDNGIYRLKNSIEHVKESGKYDYIIIDTSPGINTLLFSSLVAANEVIIPIKADRYSVQGISQVFETISTVKKKYNPSLKIAGVLFARYNPRTIFTRDIKQNIEDILPSLGAKVFKTIIRESVRVEESQSLKIPLTKYAPKNNSTLDYISFVDEYLKED